MLFLFIDKTLWLNNLKTRTALNAEISVFAICDEAIIYLWLYNLHDCTFNALLKNFDLACFQNSFQWIFLIIIILNKEISFYILYYPIICKPKIKSLIILRQPCLYGFSPILRAFRESSRVLHTNLGFRVNGV